MSVPRLAKVQFLEHRVQPEGFEQFRQLHIVDGASTQVQTDHAPIALQNPCQRVQIVSLERLPVWTTKTHEAIKRQK